MATNTLYSIVNYTGDGTTKSFTVPFPYLYVNDVHLSVDDEEVSVYPVISQDNPPAGYGAHWYSSNTLRFITAPDSDAKITIQRTTNRAEPEVEFENSAILTEEDLNLIATQLIYIVQEAYDNFSLSYDTIIAEMESISNETKGYRDTAKDYRDDAKDYMDTAKDYRDDALEYKNAASDSAEDASNYAYQAEATKDAVTQMTIGKIDNVMVKGTCTVLVDIESGEDALVTLPDSYKVGSDSLMLFDSAGNLLIPKHVSSTNGVYSEDPLSEVGELANRIELYGPASAGDKYYYQIIGLNAASLVDDDTVKWDADNGISVDAEAVLGDVNDLIREQVEEDVEGLFNYEYQKVDTKAWRNDQDYATGALVTGSDGNLYVALQTSGPSSASVNPVNSPSTWKNLSRNDIINVKDFGAKGDGVNDDSFALMTALSVGAGKTVYVPAGTYKCVTNCLTIYSNTTFIADKGTIIRRNYTTAAQSTRVLLRALPIDNETTIHDITIRDIIFDGNGSNFGDASFDLTFFSTSPTSNLVIEGCDFIDVVNDHAIDLNRCDNVLIRRCRFLGFKLDEDAAGYDTMTYQREAIQFDIASATEDSVRDKNVIIEQCYFGASDNFGSWRVAIGNHGWDETGVTTYFDSVIIRNNFFDLSDSTYYAIHLYVFSNVIIEGNKSRYCQFAYVENKYNSSDVTSIYHSSNILFINNTAIGLKKDGSTYSGLGIYVNTFKTDSDTYSETSYAKSAAENIIIRNNELKYFGKGIQFTVAGVKGAIIDGNILEHCGDQSSSGNTIYLIPVTNQIKIINNIFKNCGTLYATLGTVVSDFTNKSDITTDIMIKGNSIVDTPNSQRAVNFGGYARGFIYKDNVINDSSTSRSATFAYVSIGATIIGGIMRDNYIFTKTSMTSFYSVTSTAMTQDNNKNFINDVQS